MTAFGAHGVGLVVGYIWIRKPERCSAMQVRYDMLLLGVPLQCVGSVLCEYQSSRDNEDVLITRSGRLIRVPLDRPWRVHQMRLLPGRFGGASSKSKSRDPSFPSLLAWDPLRGTSWKAGRYVLRAYLWATSLGQQWQVPWQVGIRIRSGTGAGEVPV